MTHAKITGNTSEMFCIVPNLPTRCQSGKREIEETFLRKDDSVHTCSGSLLHESGLNETEGGKTQLIPFKLKSHIILVELQVACASHLRLRGGCLCLYLVGSAETQTGYQLRESPSLSSANNFPTQNVESNL